MGCATGRGFPIERGSPNVDTFPDTEGRGTVQLQVQRKWKEGHRCHFWQDREVTKWPSPLPGQHHFVEKGQKNLEREKTRWQSWPHCWHCLGEQLRVDRNGYVDIGKRVRGEPKAAWPLLPWRGNRGHWEVSGRR